MYTETLTQRLALMNGVPPQTLNNARVTLIGTRHDIVVNSYKVLQVMGRLTLDTLNVAATRYDAEAHYNDTNGKWFDITVSRETGYTAPKGGWVTKQE